MPSDYNSIKKTLDGGCNRKLLYILITIDSLKE